MKTKNFKGSFLVIALLILGFSLVVATSVSVVSTKERRASLNSSKASLSYQVADGGVELFLTAKKSVSTIDELAGRLTALAGEATTCDSATGNLGGSISGKNYTIEMYDGGGAKLNCDSDGSDLIITLKEIKSTGSFSGTSRAVKAKVNE